MPESVQITVVVCGTIIALAGLFVTMTWLAYKNKQK